MEISINQIEAEAIDRRPVEIVERKGLAHPDSICDSLAENLSVALSKFYLENFGLILHHNVDKALLWGGSARPRFGGGEVTEPIEIFLAGRATMKHRGVEVPIEELAIECGRKWLRENIRELDPERHVRFHTLIRPGSTELVELFLRQRARGVWLANDTSCGVGYAPLSGLETVVSEIEHALNDSPFKHEHPFTGEDIKVMGLRGADHIRLTIGCAFVDRYVIDMDDYVAKKRTLVELIRQMSEGFTQHSTDISVNSADDPEARSVYLTTTGTSAESGDDGEAGRGNRANGLIAPYRPMTMESVAGKNPVTHVGKLYNLAAGLIAEDVCKEVDRVTETSCLLLSEIGRSISDPQIADVSVRTCEGVVDRGMKIQIQEVVRSHLNRLHTLSEDLVAGRLMLDRWPFRRPDAGDAA
jgi:S-adenosylmethionine synthetase